MRKIFISLIIFMFSVAVDGQVASVEKSIFNIQTGFLGVWLNNESKLSDKVALRSEIGFDSGIFSGFYDKTGFLMTPVLTLEPRWYYNLHQRNAKSKNIKNNSSSFLGIKTSYNPDWFVISNYDGLSIVSQLSLFLNGVSEEALEVILILKQVPELGTDIILQRAQDMQLIKPKQQPICI